MYQKMGVFVPYKQKIFSNGRFEITKRERDRFVYKVPTLRNIALTAPYFHDAKANTLEDAIFEMSEHQLNENISKEEVQKIVLFLITLNGDIPKILQESKDK